MWDPVGGRVKVEKNEEEYETRLLWRDDYEWDNPFDGFELYKPREMPGVGSWGYWPGISKKRLGFADEFTAQAMKKVLHDLNSTVSDLDLSCANDLAVRLVDILDKQYDSYAPLSTKNPPIVSRKPDPNLQCIIDDLEVQLTASKQKSESLSALLAAAVPVETLIPVSAKVVSLRKCLSDIKRSVDALGSQMMAYFESLQSWTEGLSRSLESLEDLVSTTLAANNELSLRVNTLTRTALVTINLGQDHLAPIGLAALLNEKVPPLNDTFTDAVRTIFELKKKKGNPMDIVPQVPVSTPVNPAEGVDHRNTDFLDVSLGLVRFGRAVKELIESFLIGERRVASLEHELSDMKESQEGMQKNFEKEIDRVRATIELEHPRLATADHYQVLERLRELLTKAKEDGGVDAVCSDTMSLYLKFAPPPEPVREVVYVKEGDPEGSPVEEDGKLKSTVKRTMKKLFGVKMAVGMLDKEKERQLKTQEKLELIRKENAAKMETRLELTTHDEDTFAMATKSSEDLSKQQPRALAAKIVTSAAVLPPIPSRLDRGPSRSEKPISSTHVTRLVDVLRVSQ